MVACTLGSAYLTRQSRKKLSQRREVRKDVEKNGELPGFAPFLASLREFPKFCARRRSDRVRPYASSGTAPERRGLFGQLIETVSFLICATASNPSGEIVGLADSAKELRRESCWVDLVGRNRIAGVRGCDTRHEHSLIRPAIYRGTNETRATRPAAKAPNRLTVCSPASYSCCSRSSGWQRDLIDTIL